MKRLLAILCLVPITALAAPAPKGKPAAYYHPTKEGDTQVYESRSGDSVSEYTTVVKKVEAADGRLKVTIEREMAAGKGLPTTLEVSAAGVYRPAAGKDGGDPVPVLKLPAKVGDSWSPPLSGKSNVVMTYTVAAVDEEVEVPAGKFKTIRVQAAANLGGKEAKMTYWYAPGVGLVKSSTDTGGPERIVVLKAFKPGK
jgi:hypothetical protein